MPTRYGSSPIVSSTASPARVARRRRAPAPVPGARRPSACCAPMRAAISSISSGSKVAPQDSGTGYAVAPQAVKPARHSSWASAGIPKPAGLDDPPLRARQRERADRRIHRREPNGRVSWPRPFWISASRSTPSVSSCWNGRDVAAGRRDADPDPVELGELLTQGHRGDQRLDALLGGARATVSFHAADRQRSGALTGSTAITSLRRPSGPGSAHGARTGTRAGSG